MTRTDDPIADAYAHSIAESAKTSYEDRKHDYIMSAIGNGGEFDVTNAGTIALALADMSPEEAEEIAKSAKRQDVWAFGVEAMKIVERYAIMCAEHEWLDKNRDY